MAQDSQPSYIQLMDERRAALRQSPRDIAKAQSLLRQAMKLVEQGKVSDDEMMAAHL